MKKRVTSTENGVVVGSNPILAYCLRVSSMVEHDIFTLFPISSLFFEHLSSGDGVRDEYLSYFTYYKG